MAPASSALLILVEKSQLPRSIKTTAPASEPPRGEQARPVGSTEVTFSRVAVSGPVSLTPSPTAASSVCRLEGTLERVSCTAANKMCAFVEAPTVMADGAVPGVLGLPIEGAEGANFLLLLRIGLGVK